MVFLTRTGTPPTVTFHHSFRVSAVNLLASRQCLADHCTPLHCSTESSRSSRFWSSFFTGFSTTLHTIFKSRRRLSPLASERECCRGAGTKPWHQHSQLRARICLQEPLLAHRSRSPAFSHGEPPERHDSLEPGLLACPYSWNSTVSTCRFAIDGSLATTNC